VDKFLQVFCGKRQISIKKGHRKKQGEKWALIQFENKLLSKTINAAGHRFLPTGEMAKATTLAEPVSGLSRTPGYMRWMNEKRRRTINGDC
jgi:hypothetical protein